MSEVIHAPLARDGVSFGPEDIALLAAGLESALSNLDITNRNDPATTLVAKLIIQIAGDGERDPARLAKRAVEIVLGAGTQLPGRRRRYVPQLALNGRGDTHQRCPLLKVNRPCHLAAVTSQRRFRN